MMTPAVSSIKRAVSSYDTQQNYNERIKKYRNLNIQQRQVDVVTISERARTLAAEGSESIDQSKSAKGTLKPPG